jgi:hypothetical protein
MRDRAARHLVAAGPLVGGFLLYFTASYALLDGLSERLDVAGCHCQCRDDPHQQLA